MRYIQRDIEDQIEEEYTKLGMDYIRVKYQIKQTNMELARINASEVIELLNSGYSRLKKSDRHNIGSIEEKYGLTPYQVNQMFKHPLLKGKKTRVPKVILIDDVSDQGEETSAEELDSTDTTIEPHAGDTLWNRVAMSTYSTPVLEQNNTETGDQNVNRENLFS